MFSASDECRKDLVSNQKTPFSVQCTLLCRSAERARSTSTRSGSRRRWSRWQHCSACVCTQHCEVLTTTTGASTRAYRVRPPAVCSEVLAMDRRRLNNLWS